MTIDFKEYKDKVKSKVIAEELSIILQLLNLTRYGLEKYAYYAPVKDLIGNIKDAQAILEIHKNNHQKKAEEEKSTKLRSE
jgi:uncharacterized ubiquitin-like protein YukD